MPLLNLSKITSILQWRLRLTPYRPGPEENLSHHCMQTQVFDKIVHHYQRTMVTIFGDD